jgi:hypothetical protein
MEEGMKLAKYKRYLRMARSNEYWTRMRWLAMKNPTWGLAYWQAPLDRIAAYVGIKRGFAVIAESLGKDRVAPRSEEK